MTTVGCTNQAGFAVIMIIKNVFIFAPAADQARKEFNDAESGSRDTEREVRFVTCRHLSN